MRLRDLLHRTEESLSVYTRQQDFAFQFSRYQQKLSPGKLLSLYEQVDEILG